MIVVGTVLVACSGATTPAPAGTDAPVTAPIPDTPYLAEWQGSGHADVASEPFRHWDDAAENPDGVPATCAKCHSSAGYQDFLGLDGSEAGKVDAAVPAADAQGIVCEACHNAGTISKTTVVFPSGVEIKAGDDVRCMECHQGRESKVSVDALIAKFGEDVDPDAVPAPVKDDAGKDVTLGFKNVHYFAAAATLYGSQTHGGYEYEDMTYDAKNTHVAGYDSCTGCHNPHTLEVKVEQCAECHEGVATVEDLKNVRMVSSTPDYDGDGDAEEGMFYEIEGLQAALMTQIQSYATDTAGAEIKYDAATYPYFMGADGKNYPNWTPRLLKAAYNYQVSLKDPGAYAHGNKYIVQLLFDSITDLGGDTSAMAREDAGHFAGNTIAFRDWDDTGEVPYRCAKCHSANGLPQFIANGGTVVVDGKGNSYNIGVGPQPASNGFMCTTCHDGANFPNRYEVKSVPFPSGAVVSFGGKDADGNFIADDSNLCIECHQGRESSLSVNNSLKGKEDDVVDAKITLKSLHELVAGITLFGNEAKGAYQYEGKEYLGQNMHADEAGKMNKCQDCHDVHALEPKLESCETCHDTTDPLAIRESEIDYDGDGDVAEGIKGEIDTIAEALLAEIQTYAEAAGTPIVYTNANFYVDADKNGEADKNADGATVRYNAYTPRLVKAAFNYRYIAKDPGAFVHNPKYVMQFLIDSIEDLGGDVSMYTRPEVPAPAQ
jgi:hypothetical protein